MKRLMTAVLCIPLMAATGISVSAQYGRYDRSREQNSRYYQSHQRFYSGAYQGGRGGDYYGHDRRYNDYDRRHHGGIGPGKGALIGGAGGAALGALFSGSAKGAIIGGAAGAGIGALLGEQNQNSREHRH